MNVDTIETLHALRRADVANLKAYIQYMIADRVPWACVNTLEKDVVDALQACNMRNHPDSQWSSGRIVPRKFRLGASLPERDYGQDKERKRYSS